MHVPAPVKYATHFLLPNKTQFLPLRLTIYKYPRSRRFERLAVKFSLTQQCGRKSSIHIAILYSCVRAQDPSSRSFGCKDYLSPSSPHGWGVTCSLCYIIFFVCVRSFGCDDYLSPNSPHGESLVQYAT